jgi:polysaccharide export outer membrane protein
MNILSNRSFLVAGVLLATTGFTQEPVPGRQLPETSRIVERSSSYQLGPEDVFTVTVLRHPEFSGDYLVPTSGVVQIQAVGEVNVTGLSLDDVQNRVLAKLRDRLRQPEVSVTLKLARQRRVYVLGDVRDPNVFDWKPEWTIAEVLSAAGGLTTGTQIRDCRVIVERVEADGKRMRYELPLDRALNGLSEEDRSRGLTPELLKPRPGDVVRVEAIETFPVYVNGKVKTPGVYRLRRDNAGVLEAISQAQGILEGAAVTRVRILRNNGKEEEVDLSSVLSQDTLRDSLPAEITSPTSVAGSEGETAKPAAPKPKDLNLPTLEPGDIVLVPESLDRYAVLGYVTKPGFFPIPQGRRFTMSEALASAEGATPRGRLTRVGLVRIQPDGTEIRKVYNLGNYLSGKDDTQNPDIQPGDVLYVPESPRVEVTSILQGVSSIAFFFNAIRR